MLYDVLKKIEKIYCVSICSGFQMLSAFLTLSELLPFPNMSRSRGRGRASASDLKTISSRCCHMLRKRFVRSTSKFKKQKKSWTEFPNADGFASARCPAVAIEVFTSKFQRTNQPGQRGSKGSNQLALVSEVWLQPGQRVLRFLLLGWYVNYVGSNGLTIGICWQYGTSPGTRVPFDTNSIGLQRPCNGHVGTFLNLKSDFARKKNWTINLGPSWIIYSIWIHDLTCHGIAKLNSSKNRADWSETCCTRPGAMCHESHPFVVHLSSWLLD